jgi:GNAT superfamily N-acetyltransferase
MSSTWTEHSGAWPTHLRPGALRWARASGHYHDTIAFYRDVVGLPVIGQFTDSFGEVGTIFGLPDTTTQMEIVRAHNDTDHAGSFDQLVFYLDNDDAVAAATAPLLKHGFKPDETPHPYWAANRASTFRDPDERGVVFAPWVYGRDPDPVDVRPDAAGADVDAEAAVQLDWYHGDRAALRSLFEEAEDSRAQLDSYIDAGRVIVARSGPNIVGHLQLVPTGRDSEVELKNMAVVAELRGTGVGRALVAAAITRCRAEKVVRIIVATAAADVGNLGFYQRCGFRFASVERDAFTPEAGYPNPILIDGIPLLDRVWLAQHLSGSQHDARDTGA